MDIARPTRLYSVYFFDLDGTIYLGDELLPGAARGIRELRRRGIPVRFLSNNPTKSPQQYVDKLMNLGLPTPVSDIANTVVLMTRWLMTHHPGATVYPIAEAPLKQALTKAGIAISEDPRKIDIVVASYDRSFDYKKLQIAFDALWYEKRAILVATNPDRYCPFPGGRGEPDCAAVVAAIEACTGVTCQATLGKPDPAMMELAIAGLDVSLSDCLMVGDRLATDIGMAIRGGVDSALTLTGDSSMDDVDQADPRDRPTYIVDRLDRIIPQDVWDELGWA